MCKFNLLCMVMCNWTIVFQRKAHVFVLLQGVKFEPNIRVKAQYKGAKIVVTLYFVSRSHVWTSTLSLLWRISTMSLCIMVGQNPKKSNAPKTKLLYIIWCDVEVYLCRKKMSRHIKKCKYIQEMIEFFCLYEICKVY